MNKNQFLKMINGYIVNGYEIDRKLLHERRELLKSNDYLNNDVDINNMPVIRGSFSDDSIEILDGTAAVVKSNPCFFLGDLYDEDVSGLEHKKDWMKDLPFDTFSIGGRLALANIEGIYMDFFIFFERNCEENHLLTIPFSKDAGEQVSVPYHSFKIKKELVNVNNGEFIEAEPMLLFPFINDIIQVPANKLSPEMIDILNNHAGSNFQIASLALGTLISLLTCKNVEIRETSDKGVVSKKRPELNYHEAVIKLTKPIKTKNCTYNEISYHERHKVGMVGQKRGHFKTYTDEAPLFGKHTGTWFWSPIMKATARDYTV